MACVVTLVQNADPLTACLVMCSMNRLQWHALHSHKKNKKKTDKLTEEKYVKQKCVQNSCAERRIRVKYLVIVAITGHFSPFKLVPFNHCYKTPSVYQYQAYSLGMFIGWLARGTFRPNNSRVFVIIAIQSGAFLRTSILSVAFFCSHSHHQLEH